MRKDGFLNTRVSTEERSAGKECKGEESLKGRRRFDARQELPWAANVTRDR